MKSTSINLLLTFVSGLAIAFELFVIIVEKNQGLYINPNFNMTVVHSCYKTSGLVILSCIAIFIIAQKNLFRAKK